MIGLAVLLLFVMTFGFIWLAQLKFSRDMAAVTDFTARHPEGHRLRQHFDTRAKALTGSFSESLADDKTSFLLFCRVLIAGHKLAKEVGRLVPGQH